MARHFDRTRGCPCRRIAVSDAGNRKVQQPGIGKARSADAALSRRSMWPFSISVRLRSRSSRRVTASSALWWRCLASLSCFWSHRVVVGLVSLLQNLIDVSAP